jgi:hypothetical protein
MRVFIANWFLPQAIIPSCHSVRGVIRIGPCNDTRAALTGSRARQPTPLARGPNYQSPLAGWETVIQPSANLRKVAEMRNEPAVRRCAVPWALRCYDPMSLTERHVSHDNLGLEGQFRCFHRPPDMSKPLKIERAK